MCLRGSLSYGRKRLLSVFTPLRFVGYIQRWFWDSLEVMNENPNAGEIKIRAKASHKAKKKSKISDWNFTIDKFARLPTTDGAFNWRTIVDPARKANKLWTRFNHVVIAVNGEQARRRIQLFMEIRNYPY